MGLAKQASQAHHPQPGTTLRKKAEGISRASPQEARQHISYFCKAAQCRPEEEPPRPLTRGPRFNQATFPPHQNMMVATA